MFMLTGLGRTRRKGLADPFHQPGRVDALQAHFGDMAATQLAKQDGKEMHLASVYAVARAESDHANC